MLTCLFSSILFSISPLSETPADTLPLNSEWTISALPSSVRLDPTTLDLIIDDKRAAYPVREPSGGDLLHRNWIYDGSIISLYAARGEYVSFQIVIANKTNETLKHLSVR